jgi:predicted DNA-binding protein (MmcQ/YjbR family)
VTADELRTFCLSLPGTIETFPFEPGVSVFKVERNNKVFAITALASRPLDVSLKCDPDRSEALRAAYSSISPGYHLNKRLWITVILNTDAPDDLARALVEDSYNLVRPKTRAPAAASRPAD